MSYYRDNYEDYSKNIVPNLINELYENKVKYNVVLGNTDKAPVDKAWFINHLVQDVGIDIDDIRAMVADNLITNIYSEDLCEYDKKYELGFDEPDICDD